MIPEVNKYYWIAGQGVWRVKGITVPTPHLYWCENPTSIGTAYFSQDNFVRVATAEEVSKFYRPIWEIDPYRFKKPEGLL